MYMYIRVHTKNLVGWALGRLWRHSLHNRQCERSRWVQRRLKDDMWLRVSGLMGDQGRMEHGMIVRRGSNKKMYTFVECIECSNGLSRLVQRGN